MSPTGEYSHPLTYQTPTATPNALGQPMLAWADAGTLWCALATPTGSELFNASQIKAILTHTIRTPYPGAARVPLPRGRLVLAPGTYTPTRRVFNITHVAAVDGRNFELVIYAQEVVAPTTA